jgi:hypothetical protein
MTTWWQLGLASALLKGAAALVGAAPLDGGPAAVVPPAIAVEIRCEAPAGGGPVTCTDRERAR